MRRACWLLLIWSAAGPALAATVQFASDPPGAEVWLSRPDQPVLYRRGTPPCTVELTAVAPGTFTVVCRKPGFLDELRLMGGASSGVRNAVGSRTLGG